MKLIALFAIVSLASVSVSAQQYFDLDLFEQQVSVVVVKHFLCFCFLLFAQQLPNALRAYACQHDHVCVCAIPFFLNNMR